MVSSYSAFFAVADTVRTVFTCEAMINNAQLSY